jgi:GT2 family glycosyltransferase
VAIELTIVVVDNDELGSAAPVVEEVKAQARWPITYILEPRPGIPYARNAAVRAARSADLIAFIDDDEEAGTDWLRELIEFQMSTGAQVVAGPVIPEFEIEPPSWILKGRFFERPRHASGSRMQTAATGNLLITRELLEDIGERPFEEKMALTGGTDTLLSMRIHRAGHAILWCDEAIVKEWNPPTRMSARWLIKRAYRGGTSYALSESVVYGSGARRLARIGKGIARAAQGVLQAVLGAMTFRSDRVLAGARTGALGMGMIMGAVGKRYEAYKRGRE